MTLAEILLELESLGDPQTKKTLLRHGALEPLYGVKIGNLKPLAKRLKNKHEIALELYATGNSDAMYLAGLIADSATVTEDELNLWVTQATWPLISGTTVAALAAESTNALALALRWIESEEELIAAAGWQVLSHSLAITDDAELDLETFEKLLVRVITEIHGERNEVKAAMNGFVIAVGSFLPAMTDRAKEVAKAMGEVRVDQGVTACKTPDALASLEKVEQQGRVGRKRKSARC